MILNIKGINYTISFENKPFAEEGLNCVLDGCCDFVNKVIKITKIKDKEMLYNVISHELLHAYLYECGLTEYANNELLVTWLGNHFVDLKSKTINIFNKAREEMKEDGKRRINTKK